PAALSAQAPGAPARGYGPDRVPRVVPLGLHVRHDLHGRRRHRVAPLDHLKERAMPFATASDGVKLFYEEAGKGTPIIFVHEFGGSHWSWEPQLNFFARRHRCITFAARGYPPSDVPKGVESYSQERAADDVVDVLTAAGIDKAHVVGLSMGGFAALHVGLRHP